MTKRKQTIPTVDIPSTSFAPESAGGSSVYTYGINGRLHNKQNGQRTEYYLFNAFNQMKAYSDNGESYGYYAYDANGERIYKLQLNTVSSNTNTYQNSKTLEVEKFTLYPNGYININQNGEYTKHYYAGDQRIASKVGSEYNGNICSGTHSYGSNPVKTELSRLIPSDTIENIYYPLDTICSLQGINSNNYENELYFYHTNHLGSTQMVSDINAAITQQVLYALSCPEIAIQIKIEKMTEKKKESMTKRKQIIYKYSIRKSLCTRLASCRYDNWYDNIIFTPTITVDIAYHQNTTKYIVGIPSSVEIPNRRKRTTTIDNNGKLLTVKDYYTTLAGLTTSMEYDEYGNCIRIIYPNHSYSYTYDNEVHTYPVSVRDTFGCISYAQNYDFRFGVPLTVMDKSGHFMDYTLDKFGRTIEILAPKEQLVFHAILLDSGTVVPDTITINPLLGGILLRGLSEIIPIERKYTIKYGIAN
jgi:hypothetical protein